MPQLEPGGGYYATAQGRQTSQTLLDINHGQMAEHEGTDQLFFRFAVLLGIDQHGNVAEIPWFPLPELVWTGIIAPAIRASHAPDV